jgi:hypothetical protein
MPILQLCHRIASIWLFCCSLLSHLGCTISLAVPSHANNRRHVCLINSYQAVRGPHFAALFDQLWEQTGFDTKRVAYITTEKGNGDEALMDQLKEELDLEICQPVVLSATETQDGKRSVCNDQSTLRDVIMGTSPSILWISNHVNSYVLRHTLRIHNIDGIVHDLCGPSTGRACLYVGQGAGALCAGANMAVAALQGDDASQAPELQFRGLQLLGPHRSVSFAKPVPRNPEELERLQNRLAGMPLFDADKDVTVWLNPQQVYVYSQQDGADTTSLVMNPYQRGAIEQFESSSLPPTPPLSWNAEDDISASSVSRYCTGEPSEDPSRTVRTSQVEEGEFC